MKVLVRLSLSKRSMGYAEGVGTQLQRQLPLGPTAICGMRGTLCPNLYSDLFPDYICSQTIPRLDRFRLPSSLPFILRRQYQQSDNSGSVLHAIGTETMSLGMVAWILHTAPDRRSPRLKG
jgi:hypothetical protein